MEGSDFRGPRLTEGIRPVVSAAGAARGMLIRTARLDSARRAPGKHIVFLAGNRSAIGARTQGEHRAGERGPHVRRWGGA